MVRAGVALLQRAEAERAAFVKSLEDSIGEASGTAFWPAEEVAARVRATIARRSTTTA